MHYSSYYRNFSLSFIIVIPFFLSYLFVHLPFIIEIPSSIDPLPSFFRNASSILLYTSFLHHNLSLKHLPLIFVTFNLILLSRSLHCFYQEYITNKLFLKYQISDIFLKKIFIFLKLSTKKARSLLKIIKIIILKLPSFVELSLSKKNISSSKMFQKYQLLVFHSPIIIHLWNLLETTKTRPNFIGINRDDNNNKSNEESSRITDYIYLSLDPRINCSTEGTGSATVRGSHQERFWRKWPPETTTGRPQSGHCSWQLARIRVRMTRDRYK